MKNILNTKNIFLALLILFVGSSFYIEFNRKKTRDLNSEGVKTISFWQYWTGTEKAPIEDLVNKFNAEDHGFKVEMLTISLPRKKIQMAVTGGVAPDLVHLDGGMVADFAHRNALTNLDPLVKNTKLKKEKFIPVYWEMLNIKNSQWAIPLMPTCEAMHINKNIFQKYGIDSTPKTLDDLVLIFNKITDFKNFQEIGWLPTWPPWAGKFIPVVFGGRWGIIEADGTIKITANSPENISAWTWVQKFFAEKIPKHKLQAFTEGLRAYQSPDNPFYTGRVALENNGVWEKNLAKRFAPGIEIEIAPFPSDNYPQSTFVTVDALAIPRGSKNPELAIKFIEWLLKTENVEYLALKQAKFSPLKNYSPDFLIGHPNPYIKTFIDLANSPNAVYFPPISLVQKYKREIKEAYSKVVRLEASPEEALEQVQTRIEEALQRL